jgi:hypothetical protein
MLLRRVAAATTAAVLIFAAPAAAATPAAAGPSATPLILELAFAAVVLAGLAVRRPAGRMVTASRRRLARPGRSRHAARARAR